MAHATLLPLFQSAKRFALAVAAILTIFGTQHRLSAETYDLWFSRTGGTDPGQEVFPNVAGTSSNPIRVNANTFDKHMAPIFGWQGADNINVVIHFYPGTYDTLGINLSPYQAHWSSITMTAADPAHPPLIQFHTLDGTAGERAIIYTSNQYINSFSIDHIALDGGWSYDAIDANASNFGHSAKLPVPSSGDASNLDYYQGYKINGITVKCVEGHISNCSLVNFGSKADSIYGGASDAGAEAFGLWLSSGKFGQFASQFLHIENNTVGGFFSARSVLPPGSAYGSAGYCTAIGVSTIDSTVKLTNQCTGRLAGWQYPNNCAFAAPWAAIVENNIVTNVPGIAFGGTDIQKVIYRNNCATNCLSGFNCDTLRTAGCTISSITICGNSFDQCTRGINMGGAVWGIGSFTGVDINANSFSNMKGWWQNPLPPDSVSSQWPVWEECYGIRLNGGNDATQIRNNTFSAIASGFTHPNGQFIGGYQVTGYPPNNGSAYYPIRVISGLDPFGFLHNTTGWLATANTTSAGVAVDVNVPVNVP